MEPSDLAQILRSAIMDIMDVDLYNQELAAEEIDSARIIAVRSQFEQFARSLDGQNGTHT